MYRRLLLNIVGGFFARSVNLATSLVLVPLTVGGLGSEAYGIFAMALSATAVFAYSDLGLGLAVVNQIAGSTGGGARAAITRTWFFLCGIACGLAALGLLLLLGGGLPGLSFGATGRALTLALIVTAVGIPSALATRILFALNRNFEANLWIAAGKVAAVAAVGACRFLDAGLDLYLVALLGAPIAVNWLMTAVVFLRQRPDLRPSRAHLEIRALPADLRRGLAFTVLQLGIFAETGVDNLLVGAIRGHDAVYAYDLMARLFGYIAALVSIGAFPLWPALREMLAGGGTAKARRLYRLAVGAAAAGALAIALVFVRYHAEIITAWSGIAYAPNMPLAAAMGLFAVLTSVATIQSMALNATNAITYQVAIQLAVIPALFALKALLLANWSESAMVLSVCAVYLVRIALFQRRLGGRP